MRRVYRQRFRPHGGISACGLAVFCLLASGCGGSERTPAAPPGPSLQAKRFELADFLSSVATAVDSPAAAHLAAARKLAWNPAPAPARTPLLVGLPAGFRIAAVTPRGDRVALFRELDPDTTEVLLHDQARGETRLLLPIDHDARFLPQRFSADGNRLFLFTDEGDDVLQLEVLDLVTGERQRRNRPGCEALRLDAGADGIVYALQWSCGGAVEAALFESATGSPLGPLPLPAATRLARALPAALSEGVLYEVASAHFPRDLMFADRLDVGANGLPLSFGLAPAIAAGDLVDPSALALRIAGTQPMPAELWWPRRPSTPPPAVIWIEYDDAPPAWLEFDPFLQFLANRGVAVLRLRLRGSRGFGKRLSHAADGRLVDAGLEDLEAARSALASRGADPLRIAVVGEGPWAGAIAALALVERPGRFAAGADLGSDPDPLRELDQVAALAEPLRSWWITRLGDPASETARRDRARMLAAAGAQDRRLFRVRAPEAPGDVPPSLTALWDFLSAGLATPP